MTTGVGHMTMHLLTACCVASLVMIRSEPVRRSMVPQTAHDCGHLEPVMKVSSVLVLHMVVVAIRQGSSIPSVLHTIGEILGGPLGEGMVSVARRLCQGSSWEQAWSGVADDSSREGSARIMESLRQALGGSWRHGQSPIGALEASIDRIQAEQKSSIEQEAARLSIRLLLPTGLCFLPAFILIGVIPAIVSVMF